MPNKSFPAARNKVLIAVALAASLIAAAIASLNPRLTRYVEGPAFREELEKQTAKGLHFPSGKFTPIRRTGFLSAETDAFSAKQGRKALTSLDAHGIRARFNPLGIFLRRWSLDELYIDSGEVGIQTYEPKPEPSPSKPWYHIFLPQRVYLKRIWSNPADVTWTLQNKRSGIFGTRLLITPHGRDFVYEAKGGTMKAPHAPDLEVERVHMLITKTLLSLYALDLSLGEGRLHGEGKAGTREDKSVDFQISFEKLRVRDWLPESWEKHVSGIATGQARWTGKDQTLPNADVNGSLRVNGARIRNLSFLDELAALTKRESLKSLELNECSAEAEWKNGSGEVKDIAIESEGKFRIEGSVTLRKDSLGGTLQLGAKREYLEWLPKPEEVFPREHGGYLWTNVHLSGTLDEPKQDLSPRVLSALKESPGAFFGAIFRALGAWLKGGD